MTTSAPTPTIIAPNTNPNLETAMKDLLVLDGKVMHATLKTYLKTDSLDLSLSYSYVKEVRSIRAFSELPSSSLLRRIDNNYFPEVVHEHDWKHLEETDLTDESRIDNYYKHIISALSYCLDQNSYCRTTYEERLVQKCNIYRNDYFIKDIENLHPDQATHNYSRFFLSVFHQLCTFHDPGFHIAIIPTTEEEAKVFGNVMHNNRTPVSVIKRDFVKKGYHGELFIEVDINDEASVISGINWLRNIMPIYAEIEYEHMLLVAEDLSGYREPEEEYEASLEELQEEELKAEREALHEQMEEDYVKQKRGGGNKSARRKPKYKRMKYKG